jgi:hypothetical protein
MNAPPVSQLRVGDADPDAQSARASMRGKESMSLLNALTVAFVVLRMCHVIDWNWWIVPWPSYIEIGLAMLVKSYKK